MPNRSSALCTTRRAPLTESLDRVWESLDTSGTTQAGYVRLRLSASSCCPMYAARNLSTNNEALMLEVRTASLPKGVEYPMSIGFLVAATPLEPGPKGKTRLALDVTESRFRDVFRALAQDVVASVVSADSEERAVKAFVARLDRWQAFLRKHGASGLTEKQQHGLFGELYFLSEHLLGRLSEVDAVTAWEGHQRANQDFRFEKGALEVKATCANTPTTFNVSNIRQLDETAHASLFLYLVLLEPSTSRGESLVMAVERLRARLSDAAVERLNAGLVDYGYLHVHESLYERPLYVVRQEQSFRVVPGFPRLLEKDLPAGVHEVRYEVSIAACARYSVPLDEVSRELLSHD